MKIAYSVWESRNKVFAMLDNHPASQPNTDHYKGSLFFLYKSKTETAGIKTIALLFQNWTQVHNVPDAQSAAKLNRSSGLIINTYRNSLMQFLHFNLYDD